MISFWVVVAMCAKELLEFYSRYAIFNRYLVSFFERFVSKTNYGFIQRFLRKGDVDFLLHEYLVYLILLGVILFTRNWL